MIPYTVNTYLQSDTALKALMGGTFLIEPYFGYQNEVAPILLYSWRPGIYSEDSFFIGTDILIYSILDTNIDRAFKIRKRLIAMLNVANHINTLVDPDERLNWSFLMRSVDSGPQEKNGFVALDCSFEIGHTQLT